MPSSLGKGSLGHHGRVGNGEAKCRSGPLRRRVPGLHIEDARRSVTVVDRESPGVEIDPPNGMDIDETDLVFVSSAFPALEDVRDLILSLLAISPHRLNILDENWNAQQGKFILPGHIDMPTRIGVLSTVLSQNQLIGSNGLSNLEQSLRIETEVA